MNEIKRILVLGNSVSAVMKPNEENAGIYSEILANDYDVINCSKRAGMLSDRDFHDGLRTKKVDLVIFNFGVVEACTRSTGRGFYQFLYQKRLPIVWAPIQYGLSFLESKLRPYLVKWRGFRSWMDAETFEDELKKIIQQFVEVNPNTQFLGITINHPSDRIEKHLPKSHDNIIAFNEVYLRLAGLDNFHVLDAYQEIDPIYVPDGIHFNAKGHSLVAERITTMIQTI